MSCPNRNKKFVSITSSSSSSSNSNSNNHNNNNNSNSSSRNHQKTRRDAATTGGSRIPRRHHHHSRRNANSLCSCTSSSSGAGSGSGSGSEDGGDTARNNVLVLTPNATATVAESSSSPPKKMKMMTTTTTKRKEAASPISAAVSSSDDGDAARSGQATTTISLLSVEALHATAAAVNGANHDTPVQAKMARVRTLNAPNNECERVVLVVDTFDVKRTRRVYALTAEQTERLQRADRTLDVWHEWRTFQRLSQLVEWLTKVDSKESRSQPQLQSQPPLEWTRSSSRSRTTTSSPPRYSRSDQLRHGGELEERRSSRTNIDEETVATAELTAPLLSVGSNKFFNVTDGLNVAAEQRTRVLQQFLREYSRRTASARNADAQHPEQAAQVQVQVQSVKNACCSTMDSGEANSFEQQQQQQQQQRHQLSSSVSRKTSTSSRWEEFSALRNPKVVNSLLNDDDVAGVPNNATDVSVTDGNDDAANNSNSDDNDSKTKKRNRCALCRKKVGLTGFECRCGGLYCGIHRYSDKHNCTFDYRQLGAQEIRRNNPVVIGEKIQKI